MASSAIQMAVTEHGTPNRSRSSAKVASGSSFTNTVRFSRSIFRGRPLGTPRRMSPVSHCLRFNQRTHVRLTPYFSATDLVACCSQSANTRLRKSIEYANTQHLLVLRSVIRACTLPAQGLF